VKLPVISGVYQPLRQNAFEVNKFILTPSLVFKYKKLRPIAGYMVALIQGCELNADYLMIE
jgi:ribosomal protein S17E